MSKSVAAGGRRDAMTIGQAFTKAVTLMTAGQYAKARKVCEDIKRIRPLSPDVHNLLGGIAFKTGNPTEAAIHFGRVVELKFDHHEARLNLARMLRDLQRWEEAAHHFGQLANVLDNNANVLMDYARAQVNLHRYDAAVSTYERALAVHPSADIVQTELAEVFLKTGDVKKAEEMYIAVLARTPTFAPALINLAVARDIQGRMDDVLLLQEDAIRAHPDNADAHFHHGLSLLTREHLNEGWAEYAWRFRRAQTTTLHDRFGIPFWDGESLRDRHMLIWTEQGPGDEILMSSMVPDVLAQDARCTLVCTERLAPLFMRSFPGVDVVHREQVLAGTAKTVDADFQASFSHLGRHLRPHIGAFPAESGYLKADAKLTDELRTRYRAEANNPLVGISWHSANLVAESAKSTVLASWTDLIHVPSLRFVSLQYGKYKHEITAAETAAGAHILVDPTVDPLKDMDRFAAQVAAMDIVISVSNTTVHVAGALGRPVWTLVPSSLGRIWYWFLERADSPWYPSMRLFRQGRNASWDLTLSEVAEALAQWH